MTDEEIFAKYVKEHSKLIRKYEFKGDLETYQKKLEALNKKYKGTIVERLEKEAYLEEYQEDEDIEDVEDVEEQPLSQEEIWQIKEPDEFVVQYMRFLEQKCDYGTKLEVLTPMEKVVYYVDILNSEVHASGFEDYLSSEEFPGAEEIEEALTAIKALEVLKIWKKVQSKFPKKVIPRDFEERYRVVEKNRKALERLDDKFYDYPDDLEQLLFVFVHENVANGDSLTKNGKKGIIEE